MLEITIYNALKHYGDNFILDNAGFTAYEGDKIGIVGANGSGKTTILKLLAGIENMDVDYRKICEGKSRISIPKGTRIGYLEQLCGYPENMTVRDILNLAFEELYSIEKQMEVLENEMSRLQGEALENTLKAYSRLQQDYDTKGGYDREEKLSKVCTGLKFDENFLNREFSILSGGERTTVNLGKILLESHDVLLLDEPTNHLDMDAVEWLEKYLKSYRGIVIIVSHDRYFLDNVVLRIVELEFRKTEMFEGNYSDYVRQKEEKMLLQLEIYNEQQKKITSMENSIKDLRDWAQRADNNKFFRRAVSMQKKLDKMELINRPALEKKNMKFDLKSTGHLGYEAVKISGLSKGFENKPLFSNVDLFIPSGERVALIGPNGSGKSTFLKILQSEMNAETGNVKLGSNVKIAYLPQHISFTDEEITVIECFREDKVIMEGAARGFLAKFMFFGKDSYKKVKHLSGGEKVRLKLAKLLYDETNFLIMDEPTNHLDIDSIETLEEALEDFNGTILFISHDRYFINKICNRVIAIENRHFADFHGNYDYYKQKKSEQESQREKYIIQTKVKPSAQKVKRQEAVRNGKSDEAFSKLASDIESLEAEIKKIDELLYLPETGYEELNKLYSRREELCAELDEKLEMFVSEERGG